MTISADYDPNVNLGNGVTTSFAVNFPFGAKADLLVTLYNTSTSTNLVPAPVLNGGATYDYTVSGTPDADTGIYPSGTVVFNTAPPGGYKVVRERMTPQRQNAALSNNGPFPAKTVEGGFDRAEMQIQEAAEAVTRTVVAPAAVQAGTMLIPSDFFVGGKLLTYDAVSHALSTQDPMVAQAQAAAASAAASLAAISAYGVYQTYRSVYSILSSSDIATVRAGDNSLDLTTKVQAAMTASPSTTWFWPKGTYLLANTISLPKGIKWVGDGRDTTIIKLGGGPWGIEQLNPNGTTSVKGFCAEDISFYISNNGIRLNNSGGGYDDLPGTQFYILNPVFDKCEFRFNSSPSTKIMLQFNKCFNGGVCRSNFNGGAVQVDFRGSDLNYIRENRMDNATDTAIQVQSFGTFGSTNRVTHNDINNPKNMFYYSTDRDGFFEDNHCELDFPPGSTGVGGNQFAAIKVEGGAFKTTIRNNRLEIDVYADRWIYYNSGNPYSLVCEGNGSTGPGTPFADIPALPYWTNSSTHLVCSHRNNLYLDSDARFPFNTEIVSAPPSPGVVAHLTAGRPGVFNAGIGSNLMCSSGAFRLAANANTGLYIQFSDWAPFQVPGNVIKGTVAVVFLTHASVAGQVLNWQFYDNNSVVASGTITHTVADQYYITTPSANVIGVNFKLLVWNADTGHGGNVYIPYIDVKVN